MSNRGERERKRRFIFVLVLTLVLVGLTVHGQKQADKQNEAIEQTKVVNNLDSTKLARQALGELAVKQRVSRDGYSRSQFGSGWASVDGCDMRNRTLRRDLDHVVVDSDGCAVLSGVLTTDPYTNLRIQFKRGVGTSSRIQIDHVVALSDAWQKGAKQLKPEKRQQFANDPLNLLAVDGPANMQKGDSDASDWLPDINYRCRYIARQIAVKLKYVIWVTRAEVNAMKRVLGTCPSQVLPIIVSQ